MPLNTNLPTTLDKELLRVPGEEYFPAWLKKHRPELIDSDTLTGEVSKSDSVKESTARYSNVRRRARSGLKQAVRP